LGQDARKEKYKFESRDLIALSDFANEFKKLCIKPAFVIPRNYSKQFISPIKEKY
jgi:hypothetical protein